MHTDNHKLVCRLFVIATCLSSEVEELSTAGQNALKGSKEYTRLAQRIFQNDADLTAVANSISAILALDQREANIRQKRKRPSGTLQS